VWIFDPVNQRSVKVVEVGDIALVSPVAVADGPDGSFFVADSYLKKVFLLDRAGKLIRTVAEAGLQRPAALAYDQGADRLYVADSVGQHIEVYASDGRHLSTWGSRRHGDGSGDLASPKGVGVDSEGHLYVVDALFDTVQIFDEEGGLLLQFGDKGTAPGEFWLPEGAFINKQDRIYVADSFNGRIQVFEFLGGSQSQPTNLKQNS